MEKTLCGGNDESPGQLASTLSSDRRDERRQRSLVVCMVDAKASAKSRRTRPMRQNARLSGPDAPHALHQPS
eukprot:1956945-Alexandrium_andersonii.AAC.1